MEYSDIAELGSRNKVRILYGSVAVRELLRVGRCCMPDAVDPLNAVGERRFAYSFTAWPDSKVNLDPAVFQLFELLSTRVEIAVTESDFDRFREGLSRHGITLREVSRVPFIDPESIL
ncbi:MAG: hypothetical protein ACTHN5_02145 [Phycisphaerae bacterium]